MRRKQRQLVQGKISLNDFGFNCVHQGIYCLFCENDQTYVGQSKRIEKRFREHSDKSPKKGFVLEQIDPHSIIYRNVVSVGKVMDTCEALWIAILEPDLNIQKPKLTIYRNGTVSGYCVKPGKDYRKPSQSLMRQVASSLGWSIEKQSKWMGQPFLC